jgi:hypothetical protein
VHAERVRKMQNTDIHTRCKRNLQENGFFLKGCSQRSQELPN